VNYNSGPFATAFLEYRPSRQTSITFDADNLFNTRGERARLLFDPNRAVPTDIEDELRERNRHRNFGVTIKHSFGGRGSAAPAG